jgi:hypothetical protein
MDGEDVDDALRIAASEDHPPFSDPPVATADPGHAAA